MTKDAQIAAIKAALAAIDAAIAQTEAALRTAATPGDVLSLTSALVDLRAERARLQFQLDNLEAAAVEVAPLGAAETRARVAAAARSTPAREVKALENKLTAAITDRAVVAATIKFATDVKRLAKQVRMMGEPPPRPKPRRRKKPS